MTTGRFITFEGGEGAGKSTQIAMLADALSLRGVPHVVTREPGGTPGAEALRNLLLNDAFDWSARTEALLFAAARADHVANLIRPALADGQWVLCDRFVDSSRAYQGGAGALGDEQVMTLHRIGSEGLLPDRTLLLELDADEAARRAIVRDGGGGDRIGARDAAYHARVGQRFRQMADAEPDRFVSVDAGGSADEVHARIIAALEPVLP
ncbi:dTMP kinase [Croceicoccus ponticola]|uniref:Thymidylate kinase n=1 Tax=Croceicoccus ponticola TaxID=2217664 RepID=A0A437H0U6_9SPHN|nr:dTMP kinase [Croceicoccus ponticola]RVQ69153.1 dTMP kinase [Croceicoccus ponticola]